LLKTQIYVIVHRSYQIWFAVCCSNLSNGYDFNCFWFFSPWLSHACLPSRYSKYEKHDIIKKSLWTSWCQFWNIILGVVLLYWKLHVNIILPWLHWTMCDQLSNINYKNPNNTDFQDAFAFRFFLIECHNLPWLFFQHTPLWKPVTLVEFQAKR